MVLLHFSSYFFNKSMPMKFAILSLFVLLSTVISAQVDSLSITKANWKGHKRLYHEGYSIIPSTEKSLEFIYQKSVVESSEQIQKTQAGWQKTGKGLKHAPVELYQDAKNVGEVIYSSGTKANKKLELAFKEQSAKQSKLSKEQIKIAWGELILGYRQVLPREKNSWKDLSTYIEKNFNLTREELSDLDQWFWKDGASFTKAKRAWEGSLQRAILEWQESYDQSGKRDNSFYALGDILWGYSKALYYGIFRPSGTQVANALKIGAKTLTHSMIGSAVIAKNIFLTTGRVFYFVSESGYTVIAPSAKASIYATLSLFNASSSLALKTTAPGLYVANQVALTSASTATGVTYFSVGMGGEVLKDTALLTYHLAKGTGMIALNQGQSAMSLGYNLVTALPSQMAMGVGTATLFLTWDGPRLVLYAFKHQDQLLLPKDVVVDREKAKAKGEWIEVTDDQKIIDGLLDQGDKEGAKE